MVRKDYSDTEVSDGSHGGGAGVSGALRRGQLPEQWWQGAGREVVRLITLTRVDPDPTDAELAALLDEARGSEAVRSRTNRRWLQQQALEEARLSGVLLSAAEQGATVTIRTLSGRTHTGGVTIVAADFCTLRTAAGAEVSVRTGAITLVQPDRSMQPVAAADARLAPVRTTLAEMLAEQAPEGPDVTFVCAGQPDAVPGRLIAVGMDVATLQTDDRRGLAYVALASVTEVWVRGSG